MNFYIIKRLKIYNLYISLIYISLYILSHHEFGLSPISALCRRVLMGD